jgi:hypothetical protein
VLVAKDGHLPITRIIETEPNPRIDRDEIAVDDAFAARLIVLRVGDEIELQSIAPENPHYVISTIQNKYVRARFRSLEKFETMFPENRAFGSLSIAPLHGRLAIQANFRCGKEKGRIR